MRARPHGSEVGDRRRFAGLVMSSGFIRASLAFTQLTLTVVACFGCNRRTPCDAPASAAAFCSAIRPGANAAVVEADARAIGLNVFRPLEVEGFVACGRPGGRSAIEACEVHSASGVVVSAAMRRF